MFECHVYIRLTLVSWRIYASVKYCLRFEFDFENYMLIVRQIKVNLYTVVKNINT